MLLALLQVFAIPTDTEVRGKIAKGVQRDSMFVFMTNNKTENILMPF